MKCQSFCIKLTLWTIIIVKVAALNSGSALLFMHFEPQKIEAGSRLLSLSEDQTYDQYYRVGFPIVLQRLQLQNRNDYLVTGGCRNIETHHFPGVYYYAYAYMPNVDAAANIFHYRIDVNKAGGSFTWIRLNYIAYSRTLFESKAVLHAESSSEGSPASCPNVNGLGGVTVGVCTISIAGFQLTTTNYKLWPYLTVKERWYVHTNAALLPSYKLNARLLSKTAIQLKLTLQYFRVRTYYKAHILMIRDDLFETNPKKSIIFSYDLFEQQPNTISPTFFTLSFPHFVSNLNFFIGILGYKGFKYSFNIYPTPSESQKLNGASRVIGNALNIFTLAFYGYSETCPTYLTMGCQPCPQYCETCHVWPTFHCFECTPSFVLSSDKLSCTCPFSILNKLCGDFPPHCKSPKIDQISGSVVCASCDIQKGLILVGNDCQCKIGYFLNSSLNVCSVNCGDRTIINEGCDDGNKVSGGGCSSSCFVENGYFYDHLTSPPSLKSEVMLLYEVTKITRHQSENSAQLVFSLMNSQFLPFPVQKSQFEPIISQISFKIIISESPYQQKIINSFTLPTINQNNEMILEFDFDFNIQGLRCEISLNSEKTQYKNQIQTLSFQLKGDNYALKVTQNGAAYKAIRKTMLAGIILDIICFMIGFMSFKFIGVESILTLQIIYFCQLLIFDISKWPSGFSFLNNLKYASGFNDVLHFTGYRLFNSLSKKMHALHIQKLLIENFNINFLILAVTFLVFLICSIVRKNRETYANQQLREMQYRDQAKTEDAKIEKFRKQWSLFLRKLNKINDIAFSISNQISFWLILPLISAVSAEFLIPNNQFTFVDETSQNSILIKARGQILLISLIMIFCVVLNNFSNAWLSVSSHNKLMEKPEELHYRKVLFLYLMVIGLIVCFFNCKTIGPIYFSVIAMVVQIIFMLALAKIKPYKKSLKVHTVTLFINNGAVLVFLIVINLLNYVKDLSEIFVLGLGFFLTIVSGLIVALTFVRFYYDLRYGKELEDKILEEREKEKQRKELQKQMKLKSNQEKLQREAWMKKTEEQKIRQKNVYLFENQKREQDKMNLLEWVETRMWDQKTKDKAYFDHFDEKPLEYLKIYDPTKYEELKNSLENQKMIKAQKKQKPSNDPQYQKTMQRLKSEYRKKVEIR